MNAAPRSVVSRSLTHPSGLSLETIARRTGVHPEMVRRFVALGLLDASADPAGQWWFTADALARIARIKRLRAGLSLNYAALGVVLDLLERIAQLEVALRRSETSSPDRLRSTP
jgi:hypothetical protein